MKRLNHYKLQLIGMLTGTIAGYLYYYFIGCSNGSCAITSNPVISSLYGGLLGFLFFNLFHKEKNKHHAKQENNRN